jgi:hypothetical protein
VIQLFVATHVTSQRGWIFSEVKCDSVKLTDGFSGAGY